MKHIVMIATILIVLGAIVGFFGTLFLLVLGGALFEDFVWGPLYDFISKGKGAS